MTQQTPILTLFQTCNFADEANKTGNIIDFSARKAMALLPEEQLVRQINSRGGHVETSENFIRVFLPFDFSKNPPVTQVSLLPANLLFYLRPRNGDELKLSGLNIGKRLLYLTPSANNTDYIFQKAALQCVPCSKGSVVSADDLVDPFAADITIDGLRAAIGKPLGTEDQSLDLKVTVGATVVKIEKDEDLPELQKLLRANVLKQVQISFNRNSSNDLLKQFSKALIIPTSLPPDVVGLVNIPVSALKTDEPDRSKYAGLNRFIVHLPLFQFTVALNLNTTLFNGGSKLFFDEKQLAGVDVKDNPQMPGLKLVSATVNNYTAFLSKRKQVVIQNDKRKYVFPVEPFHQLNPATNTATITITT